MPSTRLVALSICFAACSSDAPASDGLSCGPGTERVNDICLPIHADAGPTDAPLDAAGDAPAAQPDAAPDAAIQPDEATAFAIDPAHDNLQPLDTVSSPLMPRWTATIGGNVSYPIVVGKMVIVSAYGTPSTVRALDIATGTLVWGPVVVGSWTMLAYDRGRVFALDGYGHLTALDVVTGLPVWTISLIGEAFYSSPPVAVNGMVYVNGASSGGETFAVDERDGSLLWTHTTPNGTNGCVAVSNGVVYEAEDCNSVTAWNALTGAAVWSHPATCSGGGGSAPAVYDGMIWQRAYGQGNVIYDGSGSAVGTFAGHASPAFDNARAFYQSSGTVTAVDLATGSNKWSFTGDGSICTSPVVAGAGGQVFVGSQQGHVYELDVATGSQRSVHDVGDAVTCFSENQAMSVAEGHLLVLVGNKLVVY